MRCRILWLVWLCTALAVPQVFAAELPAPAALGQVESLLDSCSKANPQSAPDYKKQRDKLTAGVAEKDLAEVRAADEYKGAYNEISDRFEKASKDEAVKACKVFLGTADAPAKDAQKDTQKDSQKEKQKETHK
jgi:hypothetical protein